MADITHRLGIKAEATAVFHAISTIQGLAGWWTEDTKGYANVGGQIEFVFKTVAGDVQGRMLMSVLASEKDKLVRWRCVEGPAEWIGTEIRFELSQQEEYTILLFSHRDWRDVVEFTFHCSMKWATFLLSLRELVTTGKGLPSPRDIKIDNWN